MEAKEKEAEVNPRLGDLPAMYSILNESLGWSETSLPTEKQVLITDSLSAEGAFLLPHFINYFVKSKQRVILVGLEQGFGHYSTICKKLVRILNS